MNFRISSLRSRLRTVIEKQIGGGPRVRNPGENRLRARRRRFRLVDLRSASRPRAGGTAPGVGDESEILQCKVRLGVSMPSHEPSKGVPVRSSDSRQCGSDRSRSSRSSQKRRLESAPRGTIGALPGRSNGRSAGEVGAASGVLKPRANRRLARGAKRFWLRFRCCTGSMPVSATMLESTQADGFTRGFVTIPPRGFYLCQITISRGAI
jgi:hypothetical protein